MKTKLILTATLMLVALMANAQTRYYQTETTYTVGNNRLKTTIDEPYDITLHDINARFVNVEQTGRDGGLMPEDFVMGRAVPFTNTPEMGILARTIISESLSAQSKQLTKGRLLGVMLIINPDTGKVWEVHVHFSNLLPFTFVTPAEYNTMINRLKNEIEVQMTDTGRSLNYASSMISYRIQ